MKNLQVTYIDMAMEAGKSAISAAAGDTNRNHRYVLVAASDADYKAALTANQAHKGRFHIVRIADVAQIMPAGANETQLEAHARLFLGTRRVRLLTDRTLNPTEGLGSLISLGEKGLVIELLREVLPTDRNRLDHIIAEEVTARLVGRQA